MTRVIRLVKCNQCDRIIRKAGFASHQAAHARDRRAAAKKAKRKK